MITAKSLVNPRRRLPELRKLQVRLRSLKRSRVARRHLQKRMAGQLALGLLFEQSAAFLNCTFKDHLPDTFGTRKIVLRMLRALGAMQCELLRCAPKKQAFSRAVIAQFGSAATRLYQQTRRLPVNPNCDQAWHDLGLIAQVLFAPSQFDQE